MASAKKFYEENRSVRERKELRDLNSGKMIEITNPDSYELDTVLIDSAYYKFCGQEYRFLLCQARVSGLKIA